MFEDYGIWGDRVFYRFGDPRRGAARVTSVNRLVRFEPETRVFTEAVIDYQFSDGTTTQLKLERIGFQTAYLRSGMYGGTPDGLRYQGLYPGEDLVEGSVHDMSVAGNRAYLAGLDEHQCKISRSDGAATVGIFQPIDPDAYQLCVDGRKGWAFL